MKSSCKMGGWRRISSYWQQELRLPRHTYHRFSPFGVSASLSLRLGRLSPELLPAARVIVMPPAVARPDSASSTFSRCCSSKQRVRQLWRSEIFGFYIGKIMTSFQKRRQQENALRFITDLILFFPTRTTVEKLKLSLSENLGKTE